MEYSKSEWDLLLWPRTWHKRLNTMMHTLVPGIIVVGFFDVLVSPRSILTDFLLTGGSRMPFKVSLFVLCAVLIGFLDVFCFAWPVADFCRFLAKRSEKFITPGFNIVLMKSYAYSHIIFLPILLLTNPTGLQLEGLDAGTPLLSRLITSILVLMVYTQIYWQLGIMLRTISVKSKLEFSRKLMVAVVMFLWATFTSEAIHFLLNSAYRMFETIEKIT